MRTVRNLSLCFILGLLAGLASPLLAQFDGKWSGTTGQGREFQFEVANGRITSLKVVADFAVCGVTTTTTITGASAAISGGSFSYVTSPAPGSIDFNIQGTFTSPTQANGTLFAHSSPASTGGGCSDTMTTSWTAQLGGGAVLVFIATVPAGLTFSLDGGGQQTAPASLMLGQGTTHSVCVATPQTAGGTPYNFVSWSDGPSTPCRNFTVGQATATFTATFLPASANAALRFVPAPPCRVADTRNPPGPFGGPRMLGGESRSIAVPAGPCNIPSNAAAYSVNVTVVPAGPLSYLTLWPAGQTQPFVSALNSLDGRIKANAAIVPAGANGAIGVFVTDPTDVVLDINGYFVPASAGSNLAFYPVTPCRISDTRNAPGPFGGPVMAAGETRTIQVTQSSCNIPASAQALSLNFTVVPQGRLGFLTTWPAGQGQPFVSTLNAPTGTVVANAAIVPTGANGINVFVTNPTDVVIDVNGYFAPPGSPGALSLFTAGLCRVVDTRNASGSFGGPAMGGGETRSFAVPSSSCGIPSTAQAYSLNATVLPAGALAYLALWPASGPPPLVSTLNSFDGSIASNAAIVPAGTSGAISAFVTDPSHLILDINGYFAP